MADKKKKKEQAPLRVQLSDFMPSQLKAIADVTELGKRIDTVINVIDSFVTRLDHAMTSPVITKTIKSNLANLRNSLLNLKSFYENRRNELTPDNQALIDKTKDTLRGFYLFSAAMRLLFGVLKSKWPSTYKMERLVLTTLENVSKSIKVLSEGAVLLDVYTDLGSTVLLSINTSPLFSDSMQVTVATKTPLAYAPSIIMSRIINPIVYGTHDIIEGAKGFFKHFRDVKYIIDPNTQTSYLVIDSPTVQPNQNEHLDLDKLLKKALKASKYTKLAFLQSLSAVQQTIALTTGESINLSDYIVSDDEKKIYEYVNSLLDLPATIHWTEKDRIEQAFDLLENSLSAFRIPPQQAKSINLSQYYDLTGDLVHSIENGYDLITVVSAILSIYPGVYINLTKLKEIAANSYSDSIVGIAKDDTEIVRYVLHEMKDVAKLTFSTDNTDILLKSGLPTRSILDFYGSYGKAVYDDSFLHNVTEIDTGVYFVPLFTSDEITTISTNAAFLSFLALLRMVEDVYSKGVVYVKTNATTGGPGGDVIYISGVVTKSKSVADSILALANIFKTAKEITLPNGTTVRVIKAANKGNPDGYYHFDIIPETEGMMGLLNKYFGSRKLASKIVYDDILQVNKKSPFSFDMSYLLGGALDLYPVDRSIIERVIQAGYSPIVAAFMTDVYAVNEYNTRMWSDKGVILGYPVILDIVPSSAVTKEKLEELYKKYVYPVISKRYKIDVTDYQITSVNFLQSIFEDYKLGSTLNSIATTILNSKNEGEFFGNIVKLEERYSESRYKYLFDMVMSLIRKAMSVASTLSFSLSVPSYAANVIQLVLSFDVGKLSRDYQNNKISSFAYLTILKAIFQHLFSGLTLDGIRYKYGFGEIFGITSILDVIGGLDGLDSIIDILCRAKFPTLKRVGEVSLEEYLAEAYEGRIELEEEEGSPEGEPQELEEPIEEYTSQRVQNLFRTFTELKPVLMVSKGSNVIEVKDSKNTAIYWSDSLKLSHESKTGNIYHADGVVLMVLDYSDIPMVDSNAAKPLFITKEARQTLANIVPNYESIDEQKALEERVKEKRVFGKPGESFFTVVLTMDPNKTSDDQAISVPLAVVVIGKDILGPFMVDYGTTREDIEKAVLELIGSSSVTSPAETIKNQITIYFRSKARSALKSFIRAKLFGLLKTNAWLRAAAPASQNYLIVGSSLLTHAEAIDVLQSRFEEWLSEKNLDLFDILERYLGLKPKVGSRRKTASILDDIGIKALLEEIGFRLSKLAEITEIATRVTVLAKEINDVIERIIRDWVKSEFKIPQYWDHMFSFVSGYRRAPEATVGDFWRVRNKLENLKNTIVSLWDGYSLKQRLRVAIEAVLADYAEGVKDGPTTIKNLADTVQLVKDFINTISLAVASVAEASELIADLAMCMSTPIPSSFTIGAEKLGDSAYSSFPLAAFDRETIQSCAAAIRQLIQEIDEIVKFSSVKIDISILEKAKERAISQGDTDVLEFIENTESILAVGSITEFPVVVSPATTSTQQPVLVKLTPQKPISGFGVQQNFKDKAIIHSHNLKIADKVKLYPLIYGCSICQKQYPIDKLLVVEGNGGSLTTLFDYLFEKLPDSVHYKVDLSNIRLDRSGEGFLSPRGTITLQYSPTPISLDKNWAKFLIRSYILDQFDSDANSQKIIDDAIVRTSDFISYLFSKDIDSAELLLTAYYYLCALSERVSVTAVCPHCGAKGLTGEMVVSVPVEQPFNIEVIIDNIYKRIDPLLKSAVLDILMIVKYEDPFSPSKTPVSHRTFTRIQLNEKEISKSNKSIIDLVKDKIVEYIKYTFVPQVICGQYGLEPNERLVEYYSEVAHIPKEEARRRLTHSYLDRRRFTISPDAIQVTFDTDLSLVLAPEDIVVKFVKSKSTFITTEDVPTKGWVHRTPRILYDISTVDTDLSKLGTDTKEINIVIFKRFKYGDDYMLYGISPVRRIPYDPQDLIGRLGSAIIGEIHNDAVISNSRQVVIEINAPTLAYIVDIWKLLQYIEGKIADPNYKIDVASGYFHHQPYEHIEKFYRLYTDNIMPIFIDSLNKRIEFVMSNTLASNPLVPISNYAAIPASEYIAETVLSFVKDQMRNRNTVQTVRDLLEELSENDTFRVAFVSSLTKDLVIDNILKYLENNNAIQSQTFNKKEFADLVRSTLSAYISKYANLAWNPLVENNPDVTFGAFLEIDVSDLLREFEGLLADYGRQYVIVRVPVRTRITERWINVRITVARGQSDQQANENAYVTVMVREAEQKASQAENKAKENSEATPTLKFLKIWQYRDTSWDDIIVLDRNACVNHLPELAHVLVAYAARKALGIAGVYENLYKAHVDVKGADLPNLNLDLPSTTYIIQNSKTMESYLDKSEVVLSNNITVVKDVAGAILGAEYDRYKREVFFTRRSFTEPYLNLDIYVTFKSGASTVRKITDKDITSAVQNVSNSDIAALMKLNPYAMNIVYEYSWKLGDQLSAAPKTSSVDFPVVIIPSFDRFASLESYLTVVVLDALEKVIKEIENSVQNLKVLRDFIFLVKIHTSISRFKNYWTKMIGAAPLFTPSNPNNPAPEIYAWLVRQARAIKNGHKSVFELVKDLYAMYGWVSANVVNDELGKIVSIKRVIDVPEMSADDIIKDLKNQIEPVKEEELGVEEEQQPESPEPLIEEPIEPQRRPEEPEVTEEGEVVIRTPVEEYNGVIRSTNNRYIVGKFPLSPDHIVLSLDTRNNKMVITLGAVTTETTINELINGLKNPQSITTNPDLQAICNEIYAATGTNREVLLEAKHYEIYDSLLGALLFMKSRQGQFTIPSLVSASNLYVQLFGVLLGKYEKVLIKGM